jgi:hypothetical protein
MASSEPSSQSPRPFLSGVGLLTAIALGFGAKQLPVRVAYVDAGIAVLCVCHMAASVLLLSASPRRCWPLRVASGASLLLGGAFIAALLAAAVHLAGIHGPVGRGGAALFALIVLLVVPYLLALPLAQLGASRPKE